VGSFDDVAGRRERGAVTTCGGQSGGEEYVQLVKRQNVDVPERRSRIGPIATACQISWKLPQLLL
jgi:hypothetical protein